MNNVICVCECVHMCARVGACIPAGEHSVTSMRLDGFWPAPLYTKIHSLLSLSFALRLSELCFPKVSAASLLPYPSCSTRAPPGVPVALKVVTISYYCKSLLVSFSSVWLLTPPSPGFSHT